MARVMLYRAEKLGLAAFLALAMPVGYALMVAPNTADLYNLLYHDSRPQKPESTLTLLLAFPALLIAAGFGSRLFKKYPTSSVVGSRMGNLILGVGMAAFFTIALVRAVIVIRMFG